MIAAETEIRKATEADLDAIWDLHYRCNMTGFAEPAPKCSTPPYVPHVFATGEIRMAERDGKLLGYATTVERGGVVYLNDLFVDPGLQSRGIGADLLRAILPTDHSKRCVLASNDPRAPALYARFGMPPLWPNMELGAETRRLRFSADPGVDLIETGPDDQISVDIDASAGGRRRPEDVRYWREREEGVLFSCHCKGEAVGFAAVRFASARNWHPEAVVVGPVSVTDSTYAAPCLLAVTAWAAPKAPYIEVAVPGPNPGLRSLFEAGFRIDYISTYGANDARIVDPTRYAGSGGDLF